MATFDRLGPQRSGTPANRATTDWLASELVRLGYRVRRQSFRVPTYFVAEMRLDVEGRRFDAFPLFPVPAPDVHRITGALTPDAGSDRTATGGRRIALVSLPADARNNSLAEPEVRARIRHATDAGAAGVVVIVPGPCGSVKTLNAPLDLEPWPVPVVVASNADTAALTQAANRGADASIQIVGRHANAEAFNVVAEIGPEAERVVVVSTPQSGWFHATAERGTGLAAFLALARWAPQAHPERRFVFTANSGHERGNAGAHAFLADVAAPPGETCFWLHIGANVGARAAGRPERPSRQRYLMTDASTLVRAWTIFRRQGLRGPVPLELGLGAGELRTVFEAGYRPVAGLFGPGPFHHCANDRMGAVHAGATRDAAVAFAGLIRAATR